MIAGFTASTHAVAPRSKLPSRINRSGTSPIGSETLTTDKLETFNRTATSPERQSVTIGLENHGQDSSPPLVNRNPLLKDEQALAFIPLSSSGMPSVRKGTSKRFAVPTGAPHSSVSKFQILNTGIGLLGWQAVPDQDWACSLKNAGRFEAGKAETVVAKIDPIASNFAPGSYFGTIRFNNLTFGTGSITRHIHLIVNGDYAQWAPHRMPASSPRDHRATLQPTQPNLHSEQ